jgi:hypothetical protein
MQVVNRAGPDSPCNKFPAGDVYLKGEPEPRSTNSFLENLIMTRHWLKSWSQLCLAFVALAAALSCVWRTEHKVETIHRIDAHIVLDIRQIQAEAAELEESVRSEEEDGTGETLPVSWSPATSQSRWATAVGWMGWLDPARSAQAASKEPKVKEENRATTKPISPEAHKMAVANRKARAKRVGKALGWGDIGENDLGYLQVLTPKLAKDEKDRAKIEARKGLLALAKIENADRQLIYRALAQRQGWTGKSLTPIEVIFAEEIRKSLKKGQRFQVPRDKKTFKQFEHSKFAKQYPQAKPGEWLKKK